MQIQKLILETAIPTELASFYATVMELPVDAGNDKEVVIKTGVSTLVLREAEKGNPFYHFAFNIPANKIGEAHDWMNKRADLLWIEQYKSDIADFVNWHAKSIYFFDPAGNIVELIARFDLDNSTDVPFSSKQILSISEAGLVFPQDEFDTRTTELMDAYSLSYFSRQPPLAHFKALGDDEGLFIVVPENRNWFPTEKPSRIFPMQVHFDNKNLAL